jgi:hypothetical protein
MRFRCLAGIVAGFTLLMGCSSALAGQLKTRYASIVYTGEAELTTFGAKIADGTAIPWKDHPAVCQCLASALDAMVDRAETVLHLYPEGLHFSIVLEPSAASVQGIYRERYGGDVRYVAFYAPDNKTIYISVTDSRRGILIHELTHAILDQYFVVSPSAAVQEILAEFVELHMDD